MSLQVRLFSSLVLIYLEKMAKMTLNDKNLSSLINSIETFSEKDDVYKELISVGQDIMKEEIQKGADKHIETGQMAKSLSPSKNTPIKNSDGDWVGRVKFYGSAGVYVTKDGKRYDMTNWLKAFRIEYGTSTQKAQPFIRPAIRRSRTKIYKKWQEIFDRELKDLK